MMRRRRKEKEENDEKFMRVYIYDVKKKVLNVILCDALAPPK